MGYSFRVRLKSMGFGAVAVIQMKDLTNENIVDCRALARVDIARPKKHHLVKPRDLIFRSRGLSSTSAILMEDPGTAIVAAPLLLIRVTDQTILPEYLNWYISQPPAQLFFKSHAKGTAQKMISKETLDGLDVFVPPLEQQKTIVEIFALAEQERCILGSLAERRHQFISTQLIRLAQGDERK